MKKIIAFILAIGYGSVAFTRPKQPNIIVFLVDDMGWQDTSVPFWKEATKLNQQFHTPNMERLAAEGIKLTSAYVNSVCTPSRVSLMSGMHAARHRVTNWTFPFKDHPTDNDDDLLSPPSWNINGLSTEPQIDGTVYVTPLPAILKSAGYFAIHVGKAHWGAMGTPGSNPYNLGFTVNIAGNGIGHPQSYYGEENYGNIPRQATANAVPDLGEYYGSETFLTDALTKEALKALQTPLKNRQPFFLHLAHYAVHTPIQGDKRFLQKYLDAGLDSIEAQYATLIEGMDKSLGEILSFLREKNIEKNTIIIFMSDNGGLSRTPPRGSIAHSQNLPLKAGKGYLYEGGIRVPVLVKWPGFVKPGSESEQNIQVQDFFPSILEIAGIKNYKTIQTIDGKSFLKYLVHPELKDTSEALVWHYPNRWVNDDDGAVCFASAVRKGNWKLIHLMKSGKQELYNLKEDIGEQHDLSAKHPDKVRELAGLLTSRLKAYHAQMPVYKATGKTVAWPDHSPK